MLTVNNMKKTFMNVLALVAMVSMVGLSSCEEDLDCGLGGLESAFNIWETACNAYEADATSATCEAVIAASANFDTVGEGLDEDCADEYSESDLTNLVGWAFSIGFGTPTSSTCSNFIQ